MRVLLVEDMEDNAELLLMLFRQQRIDCVWVDNGVAAMAWFWATLAQGEPFKEVGQPFDVIFLDCAMPRLEGLSVGENVRRAQRYVKPAPQFRLYGYSAHAEDILDKTLLAEIAFDRFFEKPGDTNALLDFIGSGMREIGGDGAPAQD
jgi:DNA-binding response OmpR family regulator